jgi:hypothetical protein
MSEWFYIRLALGLSWVVIAGYTLLPAPQARRSRAGNREMGGEE